ncbi:uncharacterized protein LOC110870609 [Helianthus annuus]|uniref:uncharacterized protein LOC110870609 n=1 Tax=Helianthus annuus TaxID=4232 RepID=UPI000B90A02D|nr:uncharacterized protein LOC110870609 [Helianthus annuus]
MNFLSINACGIGGGIKDGWIRGMKQVHDIDFLLIQETKNEDLSRVNIAKFWGKGEFGMDSVSSVRLSGGILCIWDSGLFEALSVVKNRHFLIVVGKIKGSGVALNVVNVYASQSVSAKQVVWNELLEAMEDLPGMWVVGGDFNAVRDPSERRNSRFNNLRASNFNNFILNSGLIEYDLKGRSDSLRNFGGKPFRVFNSWLEKEGYKEAVEKSLEGFNFISPSDLVLIQKLAAIRNGIKVWRDEIKKKEGEAVNRALEELEELESNMESREVTEEEEWAYLENKKLLMEIERGKMLDMKQRSRTKWALDGDENSKFFHAHVNARKAVNGIPGLIIGSSWVNIPSLVKLEVLKFFRSRFTEEVIGRAWFLTDSSIFSKGCSSSFITLIPKIKDPVDLKNYRPINLIGIVSKLISKVLVNRLKSVIGSVISESQSAFLKGNYILNGPLIVNELYNWGTKFKKKVFFLKIDFEKAYDNVNWKFLISIMEQMGFPSRWCKWIKGCVESAR